MSGSGKEGNNWGKPLKRRGRDAVYSPDRKPGRSSPAPERSPGRLSQGARQGKARESRQGPGPNEAGRDGPLNISSRKRPEGGSSRKRFDKLPGFLFRDSERDLSLYDRPQWKAPQPSAEPIPHPLCPYCGKPIKDIAAAITDKATGQPVHFDCAAARIAGGETLESGDAVVYIGGGRFGVVHFPGMIRDTLQGRGNGDEYDTRNFQIKKIVEWEDKENRASWRKNIEDHFSVV
ncbi:MAG: hypothetical protein LBP43_06640 [Treponema sp.]|nr:hypothetical protein [Treponema sp.]